ncbi:papilin isoform X2 [Tamandua tetradactyla]|uniref:papilin isoform X2 n=1 Tax=Tamandua tetradactyla TaxID=48850 RepID=UPI004053AF41
MCDVRVGHRFGRLEEKERTCRGDWLWPKRGKTRCRQDGRQAKPWHKPSGVEALVTAGPLLGALYSQRGWVGVSRQGGGGNESTFQLFGKIQPPRAFGSAGKTFRARIGAATAPREGEMRLLLLVLLLPSPAPASSARKVKRQRLQVDIWGPWGEWSPCSRTCGGGISFRERHCPSQRRDGGSGCVGPARSHRSCSTESCPDGARDFRAEQCSHFDGEEFQGRRYKWLPYYGAPNKCELNCIPKGENFYYKHREAVVDGTPCEPGRRDVCVDGSCRVVGCDHKLDSSKQEDKCLQCGGNGASCYPITGTFDANNLSRGYNQVLIVPVGATSILIEEAAASRNFLAVKSVHGEYYLNGHWAIEPARALPAASTVLRYERGTEGDLAPERLAARGPTSEPLVIELISQEPNPGIRYEYYLPLRAPDPGFSWSHGSWSDCSAACGGGHQSRRVFCTSDGEAYPDHMCQRQPRPADHRPCNPQSCPQTKRWKTGPWASCSASCGGGFQFRSVYCVSTGGDGVQEAAEEAAEEAECAGLPGKPPTTQACNLQRCAAWSSEPWGECSVSCGPGVRTRTVTCQSDEGSVLHATACSLEDRPPLTEPCVRDDCPLLSDQAWHVSAWSLCSRSCRSGTRKRQVVCAAGPPGRCGSLQPWKPAEVEPCNTQPCHLPQDVPWAQDVPGFPASPRNPWVSLGPRESPASDARDQGWAPQEHSSAQGISRGDQDPHLSAAGPAPSLQQSPQWQPLRPGSGTPDCRHSPHGCCPDGHTASLGPQWQGCPGASCRQSRYGCCADGVSVAEGPHQAGCARAPGSDSSGSRPRTSAGASSAQQNLPSECRGSQFGCCYDDVSSAAGPLGEGCVGQPGYSYPVRCLLPSAHGSCTDWAARWYFVASVGRCNRFWYGGCHGNANNFASEEECMGSCTGAQQGSRHSELGASGQSTHREGGSGGSWQGAMGQRRPLPSSGLWGPDPEPRPREAHHNPALAGRLGASGPALGGEAGQPVPPSRSSYYRLSLAGPEPSLVQAALGQQVRLFCPDDSSPDAHAGWHKEGWPISSDRHRLQPDGSLVISPLRAEDAGTYSCGSTRPGRDSQMIRLHITGSDGAVLSEAELRHVTHTRDPAPGHRRGDSSLGEDAGGLGAAASSRPQPTTRLHLDRNQPVVVDARPGQRLQLTCRAEGSPPPAIQWQKDGQLLSSPRHQLQPDGSLVISRVVVEDGGFYACIAFNGQDQDQRWVQIRVLGELKITGLPPTVTVPEGDTARLQCVVAGESVNIRWSRWMVQCLRSAR